MGILIVKSDFTGRYSLAKSINDNIDSYIEEYEEQMLIDLLGQELFDLFEADLTNKVPVTTKYLTIYNKFTEEKDGYSYTSAGMKKMLLGYIYFMYSRENEYKQTNSGQRSNTVEVSEKANPINLYKFMNESISTYKSIQQYILDNSTDYPEFKGTVKKYSSF